jgi:glycosyltransferase involved in cell wall biosynthesis
VKILMAARFPVGGIRTFFRHVYAQPAFEDCSFTLLAPGENLGDSLSRYISPERLRVRAVSGSFKDFFREMRMELKEERFDLFHTHGLTTGILGELARTGTRIPHLMTMHDVFLPTTFKGFGGGLRQIGLNILIRRCDGIHAVSEDCARNFCEYLPLVKKERVHPILNGIDTQAIRNATSVDAHSELDLPLDTKLIGFFGRFMAQKGFRTLVDAVEILHQEGELAPFKVVTFGWGGFIREDFQYLSEKGLSEYFHQQPHTDEPYRWMKAMSLVVMPSRWEACGLVAMEALTAGVPIVATNCIGLREVLEGSPAIRVETDAPRQLAERIQAEIRSPRRESFVDYMGIARERFDVEVAGRRIRELYGTLAGSPERSLRKPSRMSK